MEDSSIRYYPSPPRSDLYMGADMYNVPDTYTPYLTTGFSPARSLAPLYLPGNQTYFSSQTYSPMNLLLAAVPRNFGAVVPAELPFASADADPPAKRRRAAAAVPMVPPSAAEATPPRNVLLENSKPKDPVLPTPSPIAATAGGGQAPSKKAKRAGGNTGKGRARPRTGGGTKKPKAVAKAAKPPPSASAEQSSTGSIRMVTFQTQESGGKLKAGRQVGQDIVAPTHEELPEEFEDLLGHRGNNGYFLLYNCLQHPTHSAASPPLSRAPSLSLRHWRSLTLVRTIIRCVDVDRLCPLCSRTSWHVISYVPPPHFSFLLIPLLFPKISMIVGSTHVLPSSDA